MLPSDQAPAFCLSRPLHAFPQFLSLTSVEAEPSGWVFPAVLLPLVEEELLVLAGAQGKMESVRCVLLTLHSTCVFP